MRNIQGFFKIAVGGWELKHLNIKAEPGPAIVIVMEEQKCYAHKSGLL